MDSWEIAVRLSVAHTISAYTFGGDRGRLEELVATFAIDGVLQVGKEPPIVGRTNIAKQLSAMLELEKKPTFLHHHVAGTYFRTVTPELVETSSYFQVLSDIGLDHWGRYRDRFSPVGDQWLIANRQITTDGMAPNSFFMT